MFVCKFSRVREGSEEKIKARRVLLCWDRQKTTCCLLTTPSVAQILIDPLYNALFLPHPASSRLALSPNNRQ